MSRPPSCKTRFKHQKKLSEFDAVSVGLQRAQAIVCKNKQSHGCASNPALHRLVVGTRADIRLTAMASYDISGDAPIKVEASPGVRLHRADREARRPKAPN